MPEAISDGIRITYDDVGQGEPALLMMPGWCANRSAFQELMPLCSRSRRTLTLDWRGHGESGPITGEFGFRGLLQDALTVIQASGIEKFIPVSLAHAGWMAIELRQKLGERVPKLILLEWIIGEAPPAFLQMLKKMQRRREWRQTIDQIFSQWLHGENNPGLIHFVKEEMGAYGFEMWARAGREIGAAYWGAGSPLRAFSRLKPPVPVLHLYAQPEDSGYLAMQQAFEAANPWFSVHKLAARSHFPMFEVPDQIASAIEKFVGPARLPGQAGGRSRSKTEGEPLTDQSSGRG